MTVELLRKLGVERDLPSLGMALTHPSFTNERPDCPDNQRLEFLGDAVLGVCISEMLMGAFEDVDEGQLTVMRASLVNAVALAEVARRLDVGAALRMGKGASAGGERKRQNVLADAMEAIIGAVFTDADLDACRGLTKRLWGDALSALVATGGIRRDAKSRLQEILQATGGTPPRYEVAATDGPAHARTFVVRAVITRGEEAELVASGEGRSKKLAEQRAAEAALQMLESAQQASKS